MHFKELNRAIGNLDLYLLDQVLKGRFEGRKTVLDAGCGEGRNLPYFVNNNFTLYGIDLDPKAVLMAMMTYKTVPKEHWSAGDIEELPWENHFFDAIICSAVLHFARDADHFHAMMTELLRVLKKGGLLFIRMATTLGLTHKKPRDGFTYLLDPEQLYNFDKLYGLNYLELPKSIVVDDQRSMGVLVMEKK